MKTKECLCFIAALLNASLAFGQGTAFSYQGRLTDASGLANGSYDLQFILRDAPGGGSSLATNHLAPVAVNGGVFIATLDFGGDVLDGSPRWLQIGVRTNGSAADYVVVAPAQPLTPAPYAVHALDSATPPGSVMAYMGTNAPSGWLLCNGAAVSRTTYSRLFEVIGVASGEGDGTTTFNLPDLRGRFMRGLDGTAGVDPDKDGRTAPQAGGNSGNAIGSLQPDQFGRHNHNNGGFNRILQQSVFSATTIITGDVTPYEPDLSNSANMMDAGGNETRPKSIYVNYIIKL